MKSNRIAGVFMLTGVVVTGLMGTGLEAKPGRRARVAPMVNAPNKAGGDDRFPVEVKGKFGYINRRGKIVIPARFSLVGPFNAGVAAASVGEKGGYINTKGQWIFGPHFSSQLAPFAGGLARVCVFASDKGIKEFIWNEKGAAKPLVNGYIDTKGRVALRLPAGVADTGNFSEGFAWAEREDGKFVHSFGFIDARGRWAAVPIQTERSSHVFSHGLLASSIEKEGVWRAGFRNAAGQFAIAPTFDDTFAFSEGLARVVVSGRSGFVDIGGRMVIPAKFLAASAFSNGLAAAQDAQSKRWGYINNRGEWQIEPRYGLEESAGPFVDGLAAVQDPLHGYTGYINKGGRWQILPRFISPPEMKNLGFSAVARGLGTDFKDGLARVSQVVQIQPKNNVKPKEGETVIEETHTGYINTRGGWVWKTTERVEYLYYPDNYTS